MESSGYLRGRKQAVIVQSGTQCDTKKVGASKSGSPSKKIWDGAEGRVRLGQGEMQHCSSGQKMNAPAHGQQCSAGNGIE